MAKSKRDWDALLALAETKDEDSIITKCAKIGMAATARKYSIPLSTLASRIESIASRANRPEQPPPELIDPVAELAEAKAEIKRRKDFNDLLLELATLRERDRLFAELSGAPLPPIKRYELKSGKREGTYVAMLSDVHCETEVKPGSVPNGNVYNLKIADLRIKRFFSSIEWQIKHAGSAFAIRHLLLWLGGDLITNHLHDENVEVNQLGPTTATLWILDRIYVGICQLLESMPDLIIDIICSRGNHGRTTKYMRPATGADHSWEEIIYQSLAYRFKDNPRVRFLADPTMHQYHKVYDFNLHFHHGHEVKFGGGVGGLTIPLNKAVSMWDRVAPCHIHHIGHYHQLLDLDYAIVNGSVIGYDPYAMSIKAAPQDPLQAGYMIDSKRGKCRFDKLWVSDRSDERKLWP